MKINEGHLRRLKEARTSQARKKEEEQIINSQMNAIGLGLVIWQTIVMNSY